MNEHETDIGEWRSLGGALSETVTMTPTPSSLTSATSTGS